MADAQDSFLLAMPITAVPGKSFVVTSVIVNVTVAGSVILDDGPSAGQINLGVFPVGRAQIKFPPGILVSDVGSAPGLLGTGTKTVTLGGFTISA
jgi:hypothetical protein